MEGKCCSKAIAKLFEMMRRVEWTPQERVTEKLRLLHKGKARTDMDNYRGISISIVMWAR